MGCAGVRKIFSVLAVALVIVVFANRADAAGFAIFTQDAAALGKGNAQVAHADNPSAIFFNPALLSRLEGTQFRLGTTLLFPEREFTSDFDGRTYKTKSEVFFPSTLYLSHKAGDRFSLGLGVFNPFGLGTDWGRDWEGRYLATNSQMQTYNINPSMSFQATPWLSISAGVNFLFLNTTLERRVPPSILLTPEGHQKFKGDGEGIGYNLGILVDLPGDIAIGASYRSRVRVDVDGDLTFDVDPALAAFGLFDRKASATLDLPDVVHAAVSYSGLERLVLEAGLRWEGWSSYKSLALKTTPAVPAEMKNWKDTWAFNLGAEYQLTDLVALRAGYLFGGNPVPDNTFEPAIPDADVHLFTLGGGLKHGSFSLDLAYAYQKMNNRNKNNDLDGGWPALLFTVTAPKGQFKSSSHILALSLGYSF